MPQNHEDPQSSAPVDADQTQVIPVTLGDSLGLQEAAPQEPTPKRKRSRGPLIAGLSVAGVVLALGATYLIDLALSSGDLPKDAVVAGVAVGGMSPEEAEEAVRAEYGADYTAPITLRSLGEPITLLPSEAGLSADFADSVAAAGVRDANPITRIGSFFGTTEYPLLTSVDDETLNAWVTALAEQDDISAVEGSVTLDGTEVVVVQPVVGEHLDIDVSADLIKNAWLDQGPGGVSDLDLPQDPEAVRASPEGVAAAAAEAEQILDGPLTVTAGDLTIEVGVDVLAGATTIAPDDADGFTVTLDPAPIRAVFAEEVLATETDPSDASLALGPDGPVITESTTGRAVDLEGTMAGLDAALESADRELAVVYEDKPPATSTADIEALGIKEVVSEFTTSGFAWDSGQNVKRTAELVDGAIVMPGETFSLNGHTGPRGLAEGFIEAGIIQDGVASRAVGGGISQFATTLYNAGYFSGMEDVEHKAHSFYISRYPEGREATVFQTPDGASVIDVAFRNPFDTAIWIQTIWTSSDITVRFWGTPHVEVESITGERYNYTPAPEKTIPHGEPCSPSSGSSGFSVDNTRVIRDLSGEEIDRETQKTVYNGQQAVTCEPPPETENPEGEPGDGEPGEGEPGDDAPGGEGGTPEGEQPTEG